MWEWGQALTPEQEDRVWDMLQKGITIDEDDGWEGEKMYRARDRVQAYIREHHALPPKDNTTEFEADVLLIVLDLL